MARLPVPGQDNNTWGQILNDFLVVEHNTDGTLKIRNDGTLDVYAKKADLGYVNLLDYLPAGPDGVSSNSAIIRQAIVDASGSGPRRVFIPQQANPWVIGSPVLIDDDIEIFSNSWENTGTPCVQLAPGLNDYAFTFATNRVDGNRVTFRNIEIDGHNSQQTAGGIVQANNPVQCIFDTVHFHHAYDTALWLRGEQGTGPYGHHVRIINSLFDNCANTAGGNGRALVIQSTDEVMVSHCDFENNGSVGATEPYHIKDWSGINSFVNCVFVGGGEGIRMQDISGSRVVGCTFDGVGRNAVHITGANVQVVGNNFSAINPVTVNSFFHVYMDNGGYNAVTGNVFASGPVAQGLRGFISQQPSATNVAVTGNVFRVVAALGDGGIYDWNGSDAATQASVVKSNAGLADQ